MALGSAKVTVTGVAGSDVAALATQFNNLCDILRAWGVGFDADTGIAATDHVSTLDAAVSKVYTNSGAEL